ncbi:molybdopterin molybdotransferase MoeA [Rhizobium sp. C4]|uniref:molybdopterin molybdotransferase MoeA n=1 Tax=Rhizobium sp. C4 TaxID=1349800 RepID=UPI001E50B1BD|nr:gephyrin-like molybdotransferase Glp [Rhizobium sp. C4]MCD2171481.1 molybdopterin molybdotransferase MoeA [Rhizobium sp. C4]
MTLLPVDTALARLLALAKPISESETLPLDACAGRVLASDLTARLTQPPFDSSAMDGYAIRAADARADVRLTLIGESAAGHAFDGVVGPGETVRIFTGAPVPEGADAVLLQEDAIRHEDGTIGMSFFPEPRRHIRPRGQDFREGETILKTGAVMTPSRLMVAAAMDHAELSVRRHTRVGLLATGDELVRPGEPRAASQIIASNTFAVAALARDCGADITDLGIARDTMEDLAARIAAARAARLDVLVTLGGASVGDHDLVQKALKDAGMQLDFWQIAMRPGKPLMVGSLGDMVVIGLPGNPVSSLVCSLLFLEPVLAKLAGLAAPKREADVIVARALGENDKRRDHLRATLDRNEQGRLVATPFDKQDSSMMNVLAQAGCLIIREPFAPPLAAGETARAIVLRDPETA